MTFPKTNVTIFRAAFPSPFRTAATRRRVPHMDCYRPIVGTRLVPGLDLRGWTRAAWEHSHMANEALPQTYWRRYDMTFRGDRQQRLKAEELDWADEEVQQTLREPLKALTLLMRLADAAPDEEALAYLGAGPIEDLLHDPSPEVVEGVDEAARQNKSFRYALRCAWFDNHVSPDVRDRLRRFGDPP